MEQINKNLIMVYELFYLRTKLRNGKVNSNSLIYNIKRE